MEHDPLCGDLPQDSTEHGTAGNVAENVAGNVAPTATFQHDPLCPHHRHTLTPLHEFCDEYCEEWRCQCDLIKIIREDQAFRIGEDLWLKRTRENFGRHEGADTASDITPQVPEGPESA